MDGCWQIRVAFNVQPIQMFSKVTWKNDPHTKVNHYFNIISQCQSKNTQVNKKKKKEKRKEK